MANPRRTTLFPATGTHHQLPVSTAGGGGDQSPATLVSSLKSFLKKPHAIPFLLSFFLLLTWVTLRFQRPSEHFPSMGLGSGMGIMGRRHWSSDDDNSANLVRFPASSPLVAKDNELENNAIQKGYAEVKVGADEIAVAVSPSGTAHALVNIDTSQSTFFMGCQDSVVNYTDSKTDFSGLYDCSSRISQVASSIHVLQGDEGEYGKQFGLPKCNIQIKR
nr:uncharacterized protein LOC109181580 [Ipomoea batatas]